MKFAQPIWLVVGLAACAFLVWRFRQYNRQQRAALAQFASHHLVEHLTRSFSPGRRAWKQALVVAGVALTFLGLARPLAGYRWEEAKRNGLDIFFVVDTSKSMLAQDVKPDRLTRAKLAVNDLLEKLNGDSVGLIAFAGSAFLQSPVTLDYDAFRDTLNALDTQIIPRGGTDIAAAIREAQAAFRTQADREKILVLITDGEDLEGNAIAAAQSAAADGVKIFTVGVGSASGELIPVGAGEFAKDESGQFVKSRLDETTLQRIAETTGGMYQPLGQHGEGLAAIYERGLAPFTRHEVAARQHRVYIERFGWLLSAALACFASDLLLGTRRRSVLMLALLVWPTFVEASPQSAEKAYQKGDFAAARQQYEAAALKTPSQTELQFNLGSAAYKAGEFDKAAQAFQNGLKTEQVKLQQDTYYNLGNSQYRQGQSTEKSNAQQTIQTWEQAVQSYDAALQLKPDDADAKFNRDLVKKKLEELKKQQEQQQQQQQNQDQQDQRKQDDKRQEQNQDKQSGNQTQQSKPEQGKDEKDQQQAGTGQQPQPARPEGQDRADAKPDKDSDQEATARPEPGKMTREEARYLLDSLKGDDRRMPVAPLARGEKPQDDQPKRDW